MKNLLHTITIVFFFVSITYSQSFSNLPSLQGNLNFVTVSEQHGVVMTGGIEAYKSLDGGSTWTELNDDFFTSNLYPFDAEAGAIVNVNTYIITGKNVFDNTYSILRTTDGGTTWSIGITGTNQITAIDVNGNTVIATTEDGIYRSFDTGGTWTFIGLSSSGTTSPFVEYDLVSNNWLISGYGGALLASNNGITWTSYTSLNPAEMRSLSATNPLILTSSTGSENQFFSIDGFLTIFDTLIVDAVHFQSNQLDNAFLLNSGKIICNDQSSFYLVDMTNGFVSTYQHELLNSMGSGSVINDFDVDQTIGFAVGNSGAISKLDLSSSGIVYVPADFSINGVSSCTGDLITAIPISPFYDSIQWYYQGSFIGNQDTLNYVTPQLYGTNYLTATTWLNGNMNSDSIQINYSSPLPTLSFAYQIDTSVCFGQGADINLYNLPSTSSQYLEIQTNGQTIFGPSNTPSANLTITTPSLFTNDTILLISSRVQVCETTFDTIMVVVSVGSDLSQVNAVFSDSVLCSYETVDIQLTNVEPGAQYSFTRTGSSGVQSSNWSETQNYNSSDTLNFTATGASTYYYSSPYVSLGYTYYELEVTDSMGCTISIPLDTIGIQRQRVIISVDNYMIYRNDTLGVNNHRINPNRIWSSSNLPVNGLLNSADITPIVSADTTGAFQIKLVNEPLPNCIDSAEIYFNIADSLTQFDNISCTPKRVAPQFKIFDSKMDQYGNTYVSGIYRFNLTGQPGYVFSKFDAEGNLIWEKRANQPNGGYTGYAGSMIAGFDFDDEGNPYCAVWAQANMNWPVGWFGYTNSGSSIGPPVGKIVKVDKNTGNVIWSKDISDYGINLISEARMSDLLISNDTLYFAGNNFSSFFIAATDLDGNYINNSYTGLSVGGNQNQYLFASVDYCGSVNNSVERTRESPRLGVLSTGEVVGMAYYRGGHPNLSNFYPQLAAASGSGTAMMIFKYVVGSPLYDITKVGEHVGSLSGFPTSEPPFFSVDSDDNITFGFPLFHGQGKLFDSIYPYTNGYALVQMDENFDENWVATTARYHNIHGIQNVKGNDNIVVAGNTVLELGFTMDTVSYLYQKTVPIVDELEFILVLDQNGMPIGSHNFESIDNQSFVQISAHASVSPCGEMLAFVNEPYEYNNADSLYYNGQTYQLDSLTVFNLGACSVLNCQYADIETQVLRCQNDSIIKIPINFGFGSDSIDFQLFENGSVISSGTFNLVGQSYLELVYTGTADTLHFTNSINSDTTFIILSSQQAPVYGFLDTICYGGNTNITGYPSTYDYFFFNSLITGNTYNYGSGNYVLGNNVIPVSSESVDGCDFSDNLSIFVEDCGVGLKELTDGHVTIYPNPNRTGDFTIDFEEYQENIEITVYSGDGKLMLKQLETVANSVTINVPGEAGIYTIYLTSDKSSIFRKIMISQ